VARDLYSTPRIVRVTVSLFLLGLVATTACADAPITPDQLQADGVLKGARAQAGFSIGRSETQRASVVQLSTVLAVTAEGALQDADRFAADVGEIHLHVRADGLDNARAVSFRWIHGDQAVVTSGELVSGGAMQHAASVEVRPHQVGPWRVEVVADDMRGEAPEVLYSREFTVE
jgi:hypothetical protein